MRAVSIEKSRWASPLHEPNSKPAPMRSSHPRKSSDGELQFVAGRAPHHA